LLLAGGIPSVFRRCHHVATADEPGGILGLDLGRLSHFGRTPLNILTADCVELAHFIFGQLKALAQSHDRLDSSPLPILAASPLRAAPALLG